MKSLAKNYIYNLLYQVLTVIIPLVTAPYLARVLGPDKIGEYSFARSIVSYFAMFAMMGTTIYGQRKIAECHAKGESKIQAFWEIVALRALYVTVSVVCYFATIFPNGANKLLIAVAAIEILWVALDISWFFQGIEQFKSITICNGLGKLLGVIAIFSFVKTRADLEVYVLFLCGSTLVGNIAQWVIAAPYIRGQRPGRLNLIVHVFPAFRLFISHFAIQVYTVLDKTMIGVITHSDFENGYYDQAQNLIHAIVAVVTSIGTVMASRIAIIWNSGEDERDSKIQELILLSFRLVFAISLPIMFGLIVIAPRFVVIYWGENYMPVIRLMRVLAVIVPTIGCSNIIGMQLFVPSGRENLMTKSVLFGAMTNFVLNAILIKKFAAFGAVVASVIAEMVVTGVQLFYARREVPVAIVAKLLARYLLLSCSVLLVGVGASAVLPNNIAGLGVIIVLCAAVYSGLILLLKDPVLGLLTRGKEGI